MADAASEAGVPSPSAGVAEPAWRRRPSPTLDAGGLGVENRPIAAESEAGRGMEASSRLPRPLPAAAAAVLDLEVGDGEEGGGSGVARASLNSSSSSTSAMAAAAGARGGGREGGENPKPSISVEAHESEPPLVWLSPTHAFLSLVTFIGRRLGEHSGKLGWAPWAAVDDLFFNVAMLCIIGWI